MKRNMTKILSIVLALVTLIALCVVLGTSAAAADGTTYVVTTVADLRSFLTTGVRGSDTLADGDTIDVQADIYMMSDKSASYEFIVTTTKKITVTSTNGSTIYRGKDASTAVTITASTHGMFTIDKGVDITFENIIIDGQTGVVTENACYGGAFALRLGVATVTFGEGAIVQNFDAYLGVLACNQGATIKLAGGTVKDNDTSAILLRRNGIFEMTGGTISGNAQHAITGCTSNKPTADGHATAYLYGGTISGHTVSAVKVIAYVDVFLGDPESATKVGTTITGNSAADGAGIYVDTNGTLTMCGGAISNNDATTSGGGIYSKGTTTISGGTISGNTAGKDTAAGIGGGINMQGAALTISGGTISGNTASGRGGGINTNNTITMQGGTISENSVTKNSVAAGSFVGGAGVFIQNAGTFNMSAGEIINNKAELSNGGAITVGGNLNLTGGTISGNTAKHGGAIYVYTADSTKTVQIGEALTGGTPTKEADFKVKIQNNTASWTGGAIYFEKTTMTINDSALISGNEANGGDGSSTKRGGGAIYVVAGRTLTINGGMITENTAARHGGAILTLGVVDLNGGVISKNDATDGGAIYNLEGTVTLDGGTLSENTAKNGAGVYTTGAVTLNGAIITKNTAQGSQDAGAGIYVGSAASLTITAGEISYNKGFSTETGPSYGAGVWNNGTTVMNGGSIDHNVSFSIAKQAYGAGVYNSSAGTFILNDGNIDYNVVMDPEGALSNRGAGVTNLGIFWMTGGSVSYNTNVGGDLSGAIYGNSTKTYIMGGTIEGNAIARVGSRSKGGSALLVGGNQTAYLAGGTISGNYQYKLTVESVAGEGLTAGLTSITWNADGTLTIVATTASATNTLNTTTEIAGRFGQISVYNATTSTINIAKSVTLDAAAPTALKNVTVSDDGLTVSTMTALIITADEKTLTFNGDGLPTIIGQLTAVDKIEFSNKTKTENEETVQAAFANIADGLTLDTATKDAICLIGAEQGYRAKVEGTTLVWPTEAMQVEMTGGLSDAFEFTIKVFLRDASKRKGLVATFDGEEIAAADGIYTVSLAPKQIMDVVTFVNGETELGSYTFAYYMDVLRKTYSETDADTAALANAILNYGAAAQTYFGYNTANLATAEGNYPTDVTPGEIGATSTFSITQFEGAGETAPKISGAKLLLDSKISILVEIKGWTEGYTVAVNGLTHDVGYDTEVQDGTMYVVIANIAASDLDTAYTITVTDAASATASLTYGVYDYALRMKDEAKEADLVKAIYAYSVAVEGYTPVV